jgi:hypothetical protein
LPRGSIRASCGFGYEGLGHGIIPAIQSCRQLFFRDALVVKVLGQLGDRVGVLDSVQGNVEEFH